jgi:hypothetical protein
MQIGPLFQVQKQYTLNKQETASQMASQETLSTLFDAAKIGDHVAFDNLLNTHPSWVGRTLKGCTLLEASVHCQSHARSLEVIESLLKYVFLLS